MGIGVRARVRARARVRFRAKARVRVKVRQIGVVQGILVNPMKIASGLGLGKCSCLTKTRLLYQKQRGLKKQRESKRSWASEE